jgi:hypothetical protein
VVTAPAPVPKDVSKGDAESVTPVSELAAGVAHEPSPRQKVVADADVPEFRLVTGRLPVTPVVKGKPVALVNTPDVGVPRIGVTRVGDVLNTLFPEPVEVVTPVPPLATGRVPVTCVARFTVPLRPPVGYPVQLAKLPEVGVPRRGVTRVGDALRTTDPVPVEAVTPVPPLATGRVPVTCVVKLTVPLKLAVVYPVQFVNTPDVGVPRRGVTRVGLVARTLAPEPVDEVTPVPPLATGRVPVTCVVRLTVPLKLAVV